MPTLFNGPAGQPVRTEKTFAATKRTAARSHSQAYMWKGGSASAYASGVSEAQPVSQLTEVSQFQPPPVKVRVRRTARAAKSTVRGTTSTVSYQPATTLPSRGDGEQSASQQTFNLANAAQTAAPQVEATQFSTYAGPSAAAVPSAASWGAVGERTSMPDLEEPFSWATVTSAKISERYGLDGLPLGLIDQVLPRLRAFLKASESSISTETSKTNTAQCPAPSVSSSLTFQSPCSSSVEPLVQFQPPTQAPPLPLVKEPATEVQASVLTGMVPDFGSTAGEPEWSRRMGWLGWAPEAGSSTVEEPTTEPLYEAHQPSARLLTPEELGALLQDHDSVAVVEPAMEDSSAALEYLLELEHSREMEAGRSEFPMAPPTRNDAERSIPLGYEHGHLRKL
jgi:hypothetical protein